MMRPSTTHRRSPAAILHFRAGAAGGVAPERLLRAKQLRDRVARPSTAGLPMLDACSIDPDRLLMLGRNGVVEADTLDEPSTAPAAAVRDHHVIERPALCARRASRIVTMGLECFLSRRPVKARVWLWVQAAKCRFSRGITAMLACAACLRPAGSTRQARISPTREASPHASLASCAPSRPSCACASSFSASG